MQIQKKLPLNAFVQAEAVTPDTLRVTYGEHGWTVMGGDTVLMRPGGATSFDTLEEAFRVLAGAGIRCALAEWDGLEVVVESVEGIAMTKTQIEKALSTYIGSLTDPEIKQIGARGGYIGLSRGAALQDFDFSDFELLVGHENWGATREAFASGCVFELEAQQEFDEGELLPVAEDDEGVTPDRLTQDAVVRLRRRLMGEVTSGVWVEQLAAATSVEE